MKELSEALYFLLRNLLDWISIWFFYEIAFNLFVPNAPFLYPLKTSENREIFLCFQGVQKGCIGSEWIKHCLSKVVFLANSYPQKKKDKEFPIFLGLGAKLILWWYFQQYLTKNELFFDKPNLSQCTTFITTESVRKP